MKKTTTVVGERGQIVIPKHLRERFGLTHKTEVEVLELRGVLTIRRVSKPTPARKDAWDKFRGVLTVADIDADIELMRSR